jgi:H+/Cl- antiporter ClcA
MRATLASNNCNSSSGNQNSIVMGGTSANTTSMFLAPLAGRDFILNIGSMDEAKSENIIFERC